MTVSHQFHIQFFDTLARIQSDSAGYIDRFAQLYGRFQADSAQLAVPPDLDFSVWTGSDAPGALPQFVCNGNTWALTHPALVEGFTYERILLELMSRVRSHFLIHAGVVAARGKAVLLVAESGYGKTTLTLELLRRGFWFLSDEMAALGRVDGLVYSFPRSLRVRTETLHLIDRPNLIEQAPVWMQKHILDIDDLHPGRLGGPTALGAVVFLHDPTLGPIATDGPLHIWLDRLDEPLLNEIQALEDVRDIDVADAAWGVELQIHALRKAPVMRALEQVCQSHNTLLLDMVKSPDVQPVFGTSAQLTSLSRSEAVLELLKQFMPGPYSRMLQEEFGDSSARLFMELAPMLEQAHCYRLSIGPLSEMADLVSDLV